jgi:hypothetical protein
LGDTDRYPEGYKVKVTYNPEYPDQNDLNPTSERYFGHAVYLIIVTAFLVLAYAMVFGSTGSDSGYTALEVASRNGHSDVVQLLERAGAGRKSGK